MPRPLASSRRVFSGERQASPQTTNISACYWNINGLTRDKLDPDAAGSFLKKYDIIGISETWFREDSGISLDGYYDVHFNRKQVHERALRGSGGISIFIKENLQKFVTVIKHHDDFMVWLKVDKILCNTEKHVAICYVYFAPEGSTYNCTKDDYFVTLEDDIAHFKDEYMLLICGDMNARCRDLDDRCISINGTDQPHQHYQLTQADSWWPESFTHARETVDKGKPNTYGKSLIDTCKSVNMRMVNGRLDKGDYTRLGTTGNSLVDYVICDAEMASQISLFSVVKQLP